MSPKTRTPVKLLGREDASAMTTCHNEKTDAAYTIGSYTATITECTSGPPLFSLLHFASSVGAGDDGCSGAGDDSDGDGSARTPEVEGRWAVGRGGGAASNEARTPAVEVWLAENGEGGGAAGDSANTPTVKAWWAKDGEGAGAAGDGEGGGAADDGEGGSTVGDDARTPTMEAW
uniref:Uncharacterized protein n=1 Tax=Oryza rufipogon TaxID=4529 RepID=A0A0E0NMA9_ORYRU